MTKLMSREIPKKKKDIVHRPDQVLSGKSLITEQDIYLFREGRHFNLYNKLGSHCLEFDGVAGVYFAVWAPNAAEVFVMGDFNGWNQRSHPLSVRWDSSGIWEGFVPGLKSGAVYKYFIVSKENNYCVEKQDPFAFSQEIPPRTASVVTDLDYRWRDKHWMKDRGQKANHIDAPLSVYEVHLGSWKRNPEEGNRYLSYRELAVELAEYVKEMGFTHIELLPVMEHPFYGSWGYQTVGYFAPTSRYGSPQDFMFFVDFMHQNGIGVILDWVPSHFPGDEHGLNYFDGTHLFEHQDDRQGFHPDWKSYIFNYGRAEVREFLISSAKFWFEKYHIDGLRVDAVASMLYLDYSRENGEWIPNKHGGRENLEAIHFLKSLNEEVYSEFPDVQMMAEESTAWPGVSRSTDTGGLGFGMKWNMGWMHDNLEYFTKEPIHRKFHQNDLTFSFLYAFTENFIMSLSHDEVVHGKGSLLTKMPGDDWQKFANLRLLYSYMFAHPGKKLLFMGAEFGQWQEWNHEESLDWHLLEWYPHHGLQSLVKDLNHLYRSEPALHQKDFSDEGFQWIDASDSGSCVMSFIRKGEKWEDDVVVICNFTPVTRCDYRVGVPHPGYWKELLNSDAGVYGGSGQGNYGGQHSDDSGCHGFGQSLSLTLPPLGILILKRD